MLPEDAWLLSILGRALAFSTPLLWATLGEVIAERSGVVNLGVEGMMLLGALGGFVVAQSTGQPWLGLAAAALVGALAAALHGLVTVTLRANQYVAGLALTMLGSGLSGLLGRSWEGLPLRAPLHDVTWPALATLPVLGPLFFVQHNPLTYLGLAVAVVLWIGLYATRWGLAIRAVGECPAAADAQGISVALVRYSSVMFGGAMAGIAGGFLSLAALPAWTQNMTAGLGWIAVALTIFAAWHPLLAIGGAWCFGVLYHVSFRLQSLFAPELLKMLPYAATIVVLALAAWVKAGRWHRAPAALGQPYRRGAR